VKVVLQLLKFVALNAGYWTSIFALYNRAV